MLWSSASFREFPSSPHPEVCFLGRSNVGKSSLLNALFGRTSSKAASAHVSKKPGRTKTMNGFGVAPSWDDIAEDTEKWKAMGRGGLVVVDMPGYGKGSREEWGKEILKYIEGRKQLRRTFLLVDAEHGLKKTDISLLQHLSEQGITHQIVLSKVDKLLYPGSKSPGPQKLSNSLLKLREQCQEMLQKVTPESGRLSRTSGEILCCSAEKEILSAGATRGRLGIDALRWAVMSATGLESDETGRARRFDTPTAQSAE